MLGTVKHICDVNTHEFKRGRFRVWGQQGLHSQSHCQSPPILAHYLVFPPQSLLMKTTGCIVAGLNDLPTVYTSIISFVFLQACITCGQAPLFFHMSASSCPSRHAAKLLIAYFSLYIKLCYEKNPPRLGARKCDSGFCIGSRKFPKVLNRSGENWALRKWCKGSRIQGKLFKLAASHYCTQYLDTSKWIYNTLPPNYQGAPFPCHHRTSKAKGSLPLHDENRKGFDGTALKHTSCFCWLLPLSIFDSKLESQPLQPLLPSTCSICLSLPI